MLPNQRAFYSMRHVAGLYIISNMYKKYIPVYTIYVAVHSSESTDELKVYINIHIATIWSPGKILGNDPWDPLDAISENTHERITKPDSGLGMVGMGFRSCPQCNTFGFVIRDLQNEKRDHPSTPHSPPSEVQGVRIGVISFRNIAKKYQSKATRREWSMSSEKRLLSFLQAPWIINL